LSISSYLVSSTWSGILPSFLHDCNYLRLTYGGTKKRNQTAIYQHKQRLIMTTTTLISLALLALSIQTASSFVPSSPTSIKTTKTTNLFQSTATDFSLDEYLASKIVPIEQALKASVESKIPQTDKVCLFCERRVERCRIAIDYVFLSVYVICFFFYTTLTLTIYVPFYSLYTNLFIK